MNENFLWHLGDAEPRCKVCARWITRDENDSWTVVVSDHDVDFLHTACSNRKTDHWQYRLPGDSWPTTV